MRSQLLCLLLMFTVSSVALAQQAVRGTVTGEDGVPLIGVSILEVGTSSGTVTDLDGTYSLTVANDAALEFSFTGYEPRTVQVGDQTQIDIVLSEGVALDEIVVTALGIERKKKALPYAVAELDGSQLAEVKTVNLGSALSGKVAGVNVSNTATGPGGSTRIVIRGNSNISGNNQPLIVVDGVPINNSNLGSAGMWGGQDWGDGLSSINPDDIEKMTVLKGNTAAALYGYRADNGVILITTKSGTQRRGIGVELTSNFQAESLINNYDFQQQYGHGLDGTAPTTQAEALAQGLYAWGSRLDGSQVMQYDGVTRPYVYAGDNLDRFYQTGSTFTNTLAFNGGGENYGFRFSVSDLDNSGIVPNSGLNRRTFTTNTNGKFGRWTAAISGSFVAESAENRPRLSDSPGNANLSATLLPPSIDVETLRGDTDKLGANANGTELQFNDNVFVTNPYWAAYQFNASNTRNRLFGNASVGYEFIEGLSLTGSIGIDRFTNRRRNLTPFGTAYSPRGQLTEDNRELEEINLGAQLRFQRDITQNVGLDLYVGGNQQRNRDETISIGGGNFNIPFLHAVNNLANQSYGYGFSRYQVNSLYAQAEIALWNSLYLTATGRQDWFSTLTDPTGAESENSVFYPSVGVAYDLANGLQMPSFMDLAKVRASWAQVGGATNPYQLGLTYSIVGQGHLGRPLGGINNGSVPPLGLVPSTNQEFEVGFNVIMFKGRVDLDFAYYDRETTDGILSAAISPTSGYGSKVVNVGKIANKGVEVLLGLVPVRTQKFNWRLSLNYANNQNEVVSLLTPESDGEQIRLEESRTRNAFVHLVEGQPYSQVMGFELSRDASGNVLLDDNGLPLQGELRPFGTGVHPSSLGISNNFTVGAFQLGFLVDIKTGAVIYNATNTFAYSRGLHQATLEGRETGIGTVEAENVEDYYGRLASISGEFIDDADFGKLREVTLGYRFPRSLMDRLPFSDASLSLVGRNLLILWSNTDNIDPESTYTNGNGQGLEMFGVPVTRTFGFNLNVKF